jgi:hypothetical protein
MVVLTGNLWSHLCFLCLQRRQAVMLDLARFAGLAILSYLQRAIKYYRLANELPTSSCVECVLKVMHEDLYELKSEIDKRLRCR